MTDLGYAAPPSPELSVELGDDYVATLEINRPPSNYFSPDLIRQIADACDELAADGRCRAIVLCSAGKVFCAGADFGVRARHRHSGRRAPVRLRDPALRAAPADRRRDPGRRYRRRTRAGHGGRLPGRGAGGAVRGELCLARPSSGLRAERYAAGRRRPAGSTGPAVHRPPGRRCGGARTRAGRPARRAGPGTDASARVAARIAASAPLAVRSIRATMRDQLAGQARAAMARERAEQERLMQTADWQEGLAAVSERRPASFAGR